MLPSRESVVALQPAQTPADAEPNGLPPALPDDFQRDKLALIGQMASSVAHELSNPLATIVATTQAILGFWPRQGLPGAPAGTSRDGWGPPGEFAAQGVPLRQLREDLEMILTEARRAGDIVHGLLASARHHPPEWCIYSLADVIRRTVGLCRHHLKLHNISLQAPWFDAQDGYPLEPHAGRRQPAAAGAAQPDHQRPAVDQRRPRLRPGPGDPGARRARPHRADGGR
jgi:signal transduction histidine kinase